MVDDDIREIFMDEIYSVVDKLRVFGEKFRQVVDGMSSRGFDGRSVGDAGGGGHGTGDAQPEDHDPGHENEPPTVHVVDRYD